MGIKIRKRKEDDAPGLLELINSQSVDSLLLKKTLEQILNYNYFVAESKGGIIGAIGYKTWPNDQVEIISFVVKEKCRGRGVGKLLLEYCLKDIKDNAVASAFTLTTVPGIFEKFGFKKVSIKDFPQKIWEDCRHCPRNAGGPNDPRCNETAMVLNFK